MTAARFYYPDNHYLRAFSWLFLFFLLTSGKWLFFFLCAVAFSMVKKRGRLSLDAFQATVYAHPFSREQIILLKDKIRVYTGTRRFGACLIMGDNTSVQEIVLYAWAFRPQTLQAIRNSLDSPGSF